MLSALELAGFNTAQSQSNAFGNIVTPRKLTRMLQGGNVPSMFARGAEHAFGVKRGWMDLPYNAPPALPKRLARPVYAQTIVPNDAAALIASAEALLSQINASIE